MSLPREFNKALHKKAGFYAAWFPVATPFEIGDYGVISNGVFQKTGHLNDLRSFGFNVGIRKKSGSPVSLDFLSEGARSIKLVAGATVQVLPEQDVEAHLTYEFDKKNSFVVKAAKMNVEAMDNIQEVADALARLRRENVWSSSFHVISSTYTGKDCLILLSTEAGTKVEFTASAKALKQLDLGNVEVKPSVSFSSSTVLHSIGEAGVIGLKLFKLRLIGGGINLMAAGDLQKEEREFEEDWDDDLEDLI